MNILALDLSLTATGVCKANGETDVIKSGNWRGPARLRYVRQAVLALLSTDLSDVVVIEGYSYGSKGSSVVNIGELGGVIRVLFLEYDIPYVEVPPSCLKKYATGKGNAPKDDVLQQAVLRAGRAFKDNNAADAWWLWQMALAHYVPDNPLLVKMPAANRAGLEKVDWWEPETFVPREET